MRVRFVAAGVVVLILAACGVWWWQSKPAPGPVTKPARASSAAAASSASAAPTPLGQLETDIVTQGLTPERAKQLFSLMVAPLPGVAVSAPPSRDSADFDGTLAVSYIFKFWSSLTPEQQRAAARAIGTAPAMSADLDADSPAPPASARMPTILPARFWYGGGQQPRFDYHSLLRVADSTLASMLNVPYVPFAEEVDYDPPVGPEYAHTNMWWEVPVFGDWKIYPGSACHVFIHDQMFALADLEDAQSIMTHEMMHCFQEREAVTHDNWASLAPWISEGEATWVMAAVVPSAFAFRKYWKAYAESPATVYYNRWWDGLGIFGHMSDIAGDSVIWPKLLPMVKEGIQSGHGEPAFADLIAGNEGQYYTSWGSSYFLEPNRTPWTMIGPGKPPTYGITADALFVPTGASQSLVPVAPYVSRIDLLKTDADVLLIGLLTGYGRLHDDGFGVDTALDNSGALALCMKQGGCTCPDGSPGASLVTKPASAPLSIGVNGGDTLAEVTLVAKSLDEFCKKPDPKPQWPLGPGGGGGGGGGGTPPEPDQKPPDGWSHDDVHMVTFDGLRYDFQVVGEYTLVRSTKDDFGIQVRQVPAKQSKSVSINQAVATKIGDRRVTIEMENGAPVLRVDGAVVGDQLPRFSGGSIARATTMYGTTYQLSWSDGTTANVAQVGARLLNVRVKPAGARRGTLTGLLGDDNGSPDNDLVGVGGATLGTQPAPDQLTHTLADRWRITQAASLFDYQPGQTTATFTDATFPDSHVDPTRVPNRAAAEQNCREAGITDPGLLENCILDYAVTSDFLFTSSYAHEQQVIAARALIAPPKASGVLRTVMLEGVIATPSAHPSVHFEARAGDIIWIGNPDCTDNYMQMGLLGPDGKGLAGGAVCAMGRQQLTAAGTYTLQAGAGGNPVGTYHVPIRFIRPDRVVAVSPNAVVAGRIETRAAHDVYTFEGHAGDVVRVSGAGCDTASLVLGLILPSGADMLGPACRAGSDKVLTQDGTYRLVVNAGDNGPDPYHFVFQIASGRAGK